MIFSQFNVSGLRYKTFFTCLNIVCFLESFDEDNYFTVYAWYIYQDKEKTPSWCWWGISLFLLPSLLQLWELSHVSLAVVKSSTHIKLCNISSYSCYIASNDAPLLLSHHYRMLDWTGGLGVHRVSFFVHECCTQRDYKTAVQKQIEGDSSINQSTG